jgi:hypothetical protein
VKKIVRKGVERMLLPFVYRRFYIGFTGLKQQSEAN